MVEEFKDLFEEYGEWVEASSNRPILLDGRDNVWILRSGKVEVFSVQVRDNKPFGARRHILTAVDGEALFGLDWIQSGKEMGLLAVGTPGTRLIRMNRDKLMELYLDPEYGFLVGYFLHKWVMDFSLGVIKELPPRHFTELTAGADIALAEDERARPRTELLWIGLKKGSALFSGWGVLPEVEGHTYFPLAKYGWLRAISDADISVIDTKTLLTLDPQLKSLDHFHTMVLEGIVTNRDLAELMEWERLEEKRKSDRALAEESIYRFAAILAKKEKKKIVAGGDPLFAACRTVGDAVGVQIREHPDARLGKEQRDPLGAIARASRIRIREVMLRDRWWKMDNGPLVAFTEEGNKPVALLPESPTSYLLYDPEERKSTRVNEQTANTLQPQAVTFYRPFPIKTISIIDIIRMALTGCGRDVITIFTVGMIGGMLGMVAPLATGLLFDSVIPTAEKGQLYQLVLGLIMALFGVAMFQITRTFAVTRIEGKADARVQSAVWDRLLDLPAPFFRQFTVGDLANRALSVTQIRALVSGAVMSSILSSIFSVFNFFLLFYYSIYLALTAAVLVVFFVGVTIIGSLIQLKYQKALLEIQGKISGMVLQQITGISKLRVAGAEIRAYSEWARKFTEQKQTAYNVRHTSNLVTLFNVLFPVASSIAIFSMIAFYMTAAQEAGAPEESLGFSTGDFLAFNAAYGAFIAAAIQLSTVLMTILQILPLYQRAKPILSTMPEVTEMKTDPGELSGEIEFSHVSFAYKKGGPVILRDISLYVRPGEFVALVGPSGSGKSTILRLLLGFEIPETGSIYYDGQNLGDIDLREFRSQLGCVLQNGRIMSGDIYSNIIGATRMTLDDAWAAAEMAGFADDVRMMPMEMHTYITEGGGTLSGGQRQRLMIARALVTKPRIIFFDEATSALDNRTQSIVSESLERLASTRIVIAHRLSTIVNADRILVIDDGQVVEQGTYKDLMEKGTIFPDLAKRQLA